jgi:succinylglutamic semialdehyde dehydrogenase
MISLETVLKKELKAKGNFIDGKWRIADRSQGAIHVVSPANFDWKLPDCQYGFSEIEEAVAAGNRAFTGWSRRALDDRIGLLKKLIEEFEVRKDEIARVVALEIGKPLDECRTEAGALVNKIKLTIEDGLKLVSTQEIDLGSGSKGQIVFRPKGVLLVIGPFNFPVHLSNGHIIPALLTGNTVILKPSEKAPYSAQLYIECFERVGFPPGVIQLLQGTGEVAQRLIRSKGIHGILATTSYEIGAKIQKEVAEEPEKIVALEMGGKNAAIVWEGADPEKVSSDLIQSSFLSTGQRCTALSRIYIHPALLEPVLSKFHEKAKSLLISHPFEEDPKPFMGPIITAAAKEKYLRYSDIAQSEGAEIIMRPKALDGNSRISKRPLPMGHYVTPSIAVVKNWSPKSNYQNHEIFGPDVFFAPVKTLDEAIEAANSAKYGLAFSFFGKSQEFSAVADRIEAGLVYCNRPTTGASSRLPFGGWKRSGNHRPAGIFAIYYTTQVQARIF